MRGVGDREVLLDRGLVGDRDVEVHDDRHADPDGLAGERDEARVGLLVQGERLGAERRESLVALTPVGVDGGRRHAVAGARLEALGGGPGWSCPRTARRPACLPPAGTSTGSKVPSSAVSVTVLSTLTPASRTLLATVTADSGAAADEAGAAGDAWPPPVEDEADGSAVVDVQPAARAETASRLTSVAACRRGRVRSTPPGRSDMGSPRDVDVHPQSNNRTPGTDCAADGWRPSRRQTTRWPAGSVRVLPPRSTRRSSHTGPTRPGRHPS